MADRGALRPAFPGHRLTAGAPGDDVTAASASDDAARVIGHSFSRPELLAEALTHRSALGKPVKGRRRPKRGAAPANYERLEFLGDRVLGLVVADLLWRRFAAEPEGHLTRRLTQLVRREALTRVAGELGLGPHLRLSPAEAAAGATRNPGILADVVEAVIAAIYLDGGLPAAFAFIERHWTPLIAEMETAPLHDPKTTLQEWAQGTRPAVTRLPAGGDKRSGPRAAIHRRGGCSRATARLAPPPPRNAPLRQPRRRRCWSS
jgi:ribonuclease-3